MGSMQFKDTAHKNGNVNGMCKQTLRAVCVNTAIMLRHSSLLTMESLENGVATHFGATPLWLNESYVASVTSWQR